MSQDILSRLDKPSATAQFDALPVDIQKVLKRAATRGAANLANGMTLRIDRDWIMVPTRRGAVQVAIGTERAYRL